jgi:Asp-tRNA(Asn)/Glu-tRNA(Gln) amidotransferase C subunit
MSADQARASLTQDALLANAPLAQDGFLRVRGVLEE